MAGTCYLVYSGGTINLQEHAAGMDFDYTPQAKNLTDEFAIDTARLRIANASIINIRNALGSVSRALNEAQIYNSYGGGTAPVYLYMQPAGYPDAWRSEVITGNITPADYVTDAAIWEAPGIKTIEFNMDLTRRNYFEGTLTPLTLSNPNGTSTTVYWDTFNDGGGIATKKRYNYVDIPGTAITGDLVAPVQLTVIDTNALNGADYTGFQTLNIHVGWSGDQTANTRFEAESGTAYGGTAYTSATGSNGTVIGTATGFFNALPDYDKYQGNYYQVYTREKGGTIATSYYAETIAYSNLSVSIYRTAPVVFSNNLTSAFYWREIGMVRLPSNYVGGTINANVNLSVHSGTTVDFDVTHALPMDKRIVCKSSLQVKQMTYDTITNNHYAWGGVVGTFTISAPMPLVVYGDLGLMPGKNNRIHFMDTASTKNPMGTAYYTVSVNYRPRRVTL